MKKRRFLSVLLAALTALSVGLFSACDDKKKVETGKEYTIRYAYDGKTYDLQVWSGELYSLETLPEKSGYEFMGLYDAADGGKIYVDSNGASLKAFSANKNMVLFPQFRPREYTVIFEYGEDVAVTGERSVKVACDSEITDIPTGLTADHKVFKGWYTEPNCGGKRVADQYGVRPEMEIFSAKNYDLENSDGYVYLYAGFDKQKYLVTFCFGGSVADEEIEVPYDTPVSEVIPETRVDGKAVLKWSERQYDTEKNYLFTGRIRESMTLYAAEYAPVIDFDVKGGDEVSSIVRESGTTVVMPAANKTNYTFLYWTDKEGNIYRANDNVILTESLKLEAVWQAMLVFNEQGGVEVEDITAAQGVEIVLPTTKKTGFIFAGWYVGDEKYTSTVMPTDSVLLTAKYYEILTKKIVVLTENKSKETLKTSPNMDVSYKMNVSELYSAGVREVSVKVNYQTKSDAAGTKYSTTYRVTPYMSWYSTDTASDANKLWQYGKEIASSSWSEVFTFSTGLTLTGDFIYICYWTTKTYSSTGSSQETYFKNFWVEFTYPDMNTLK